MGGLFAAFRIKRSLVSGDGIIKNEGQLVFFLFGISVLLILIVLLLIFFLTVGLRKILKKNRTMNEVKRSRLSFVITIAVTFVLMGCVVVYNSEMLYNASVVSTYEDGAEEIKTVSKELENYLTVASTTLRVTADNVDLMYKDGCSSGEIEKYIVDQTKKLSEQFDENFTGLYAYIDGEYLDGLGWVPPQDYEPTSRAWYKTAVSAQGETAIVSPYVDAQTGSVVITFARCISEGSDDQSKNVVCLDVIVNHVKEVVQAASVAGKGYGIAVNNDGFIVSYSDEELDGKNIADVYGEDVLNSILETNNGRTTVNIDDEKCTLFIYPVMEQWYSVIVVRNAELFEETYSQLAVNIFVSFISFGLISFLYYIGYKNEKISGKKVEEMNLQVVTALATAIDAKDNYTNGHSSRVAEYARMIAARAGYTEPQQDEIYMIGLLHDVGKIGVPDSVINKPSRLTDEEFDLIKKHPVIGDDILKSIKGWPKLATGARWHHERYGGGGYPDGIKGEEIPEEARIIAVADAYDAMTSRRSYRDIMSQEKVRSEIERGRGTQFDPKFADIMLQMIDEDKEFSMREKTADSN